jgi:rhodanese-related sulfurtransferase
MRGALHKPNPPAIAGRHRATVLRMSKDTIKTIGCHELQAICGERAVDLVDVRTPEEFSLRRAAGARNVPLDVFDPHAVHQSRTVSLDEPIYFICEAGIRSHWACQAMTAAGYANVVNVVGGTGDWEARELPLERGALK